MTNDYLRDLDDWDEESQQILLSLTKENAFLSFKEMEKGVFGKEGKDSFEKIRITANSDRMISPFYKEFGLKEGESIKVDVPISIFNYIGKKTSTNKKATEENPPNEKPKEVHGYAYETLVQVEDTGTKVFEAYQKEKSGFNPYHVKLYYEKLNNHYFNFSGRNCIVNIGNTYYKNFISQFPKQKIRSWYDNRTKSIIVDSIELEAQYTKLVLDSVHQDNQLSEVDIYKAIQLNAWSKSEAGSILNAIGSINDGMAEAVTKIAELIGKCKIEEKRYLADDKEYKPFLFDKTPSSPTILSIGIGITVLEKLVQKNLSLLKKLNVENYLPSGFKKAIEELIGFTTKVNTMIKSAVTIVADIAGEYLKLVNAFVCGLINGLISLFEFAFQIISFMIGLDGFIKSYDDYLEQQKNIETLEEVLNFLFSEASTFLDGFINLIKDLKNTTSEDFEALIRSLSEKLGNISRYQYAYYAGNIVFEVIIGVLLAVFTGGAGNAVKAANTTEKFLHYLKIIGCEFISTVTFGITDLLAILRKLLQSFARVCKNGFEGFIKWVENIFSGLKNGKKVDNLIEEATDLEELIITVERKNPKRKINRQQEILNAKTIDKKPLPTYDEGFEYYEAKTPGDFDIPIVLRRQSKLLMHKVDREVQNLLNPNITSGFSKGKKVFLNKNGLKSVKEGWLIDRVLVAGMIHRDKKLGEIIVTKINYPKSEMNKLLRKNDRERGKVSLSDVKELYNHFKKTGYLDYGMHPYIENLLKNHFDEIAKGIKYPSSYNWELTGGLPGTHAEVLALNDLLWKLESKKVTLTEEVLKGFLGYNKNIKKQQYMIRCGDCQLILKDVLFLEKVTKFK